MAPKLRIIYYEKDGSVLSYFFLEKTEALRVIAILKLLPTFTEWTPLSLISKKINASLLSTQSTILKLSGAQSIDIINNGERQVVAEHPILFIKKDRHNTRNNLKRYKFLRPTIYVKQHC